MSELGLPIIPDTKDPTDSYMDVVKRVLTVGAAMAPLVVDGEAASPPPSPVLGATYIMINDDLDLWPDVDADAAQEGWIAIYVPVKKLDDEDGTWMYLEPDEGWTCYDKTIKGRRIYSSDNYWVEVPSIPIADITAATLQSNREYYNRIADVLRTHGISQEQAYIPTARVANINVQVLPIASDVVEILPAEVDVISPGLGS